MPKVQREASLSEKAVQHVAAESITFTSRRGRGPARNSAVVTSRLCDPLVWQTALKLAGGDAKRIRVLSRTEVMVENSRA